MAQGVLREHHIDLVITDLMMPRLDGMDLIRWASDEGLSPIWIVLSGMDTFDAAVEAIHLGAFDFLTKPPHIPELEVAVRNALNHAQLLRERALLLSRLEESNRQLQDKVEHLGSACRLLEEQSESMTQDLRRAEVIQQSLLPDSPPEFPGFSFNCKYVPGFSVAGDLYDVARVSDRHVAFYVADASGHGVSAAMLAVLFKQRLKMIDSAGGAPLAPCDVLSAVNRALLDGVTAPCMFLTAAYCLLETQTGRLSVSTAGHPPSLLQRSSGETLSIKPSGPALGLSSEATFGQEDVHLQPGDRVLLYTDGLLDALDTAQDSGASAFDCMARTLKSADARGIELLSGLITSTPEYRSDPDRDDVTAVLVESGAGASNFDHGDFDRAIPSRVAREPVVFYGESDGRAFFNVRGRGTWSYSITLYDTARALLAAGHELVLNFSSCDYLDSTFLGTIHEIVCAQACTHGSNAELQGVGQPLMDLFDELAMQCVIDKIRALPLPLPDSLLPLDQANVDEATQRSRLLRAHSTLVSLHPKNREQFQAVIDSLRDEQGRV